MSNRKITHEVKLQKSVIIILAVLAVGVMANAFAPVFSVNEALAAFNGQIWGTLNINCSGCN